MVSFDLKKIFHYLLFIFLAISTFFYLPVTRSMHVEEAVEWGYAIQEMFFRYGIAFLVLFSLLLKPKRSTMNVYIILFALYSILVNLLQFDIAARRAVLNIFLAVIFYKTLLDHFDFSYLKLFSKFAAGVLIANLILCVMQYYNYDPIYAKPEIMGKMDQMVGFMKLKVHLGLLAAMLAPFLFYLNPYFLVIVLPLLFWGFSSTSIVAFLAVTLLLLKFKMSFKVKKNVWIFSGIATVLVLSGAFYIYKFDFPSGQFSERFKIWFETLSYLLRANPFLGLGLGHFARWEPVTNQVTNQTKLSWLWAHNEYLQAAFEMGIVGFIIIFLYLKKSFRDFTLFHADGELQVLFGAFFTIAMLSFLHFPFHLGRFSPLCVFVMALFETKLEDLRCR